MADVARFVRDVPAPALPPPLSALGPIAWARANLFSSAASSLVTIALIALALWLLPPLIGWATWQAIWSAPDGALCRANQDGACWAFIAQKSNYLLFGSYPESEHWRVTLDGSAGRRLDRLAALDGRAAQAVAAVLFFFVYPVVAFVLLHGSTTLGLPIVDTILWGGVFVSLLVSLVGIVFSLPLGVLLALGRRSRQPVIKALSIIFIEVVRGVPFITVLFMANNLLPLFVPDDYAPDRFLRPLVGTALFAAAYLAEEVRGGLQTLPKGQYEAACRAWGWAIGG